MVFGDHTRIFKFVDFPFVIGADGAKILTPDPDMFEPKFFYYSLLNVNLENRGYSRHYRYLKEKTILRPPLSVQRRIVEILEKADAVRSKRRLADEKTSRILQAAFVRMFRDPKIPKERIGNLVNRTEVRDPTKNPDEEFIYVDIAGVDNKTGGIKETKKFLGKDAPSRARRVIRAGDVIVSTVRPNLNATALVPNELDNQICSTGFCVLQCSERLNNRYLYVFTRLQPFIEQLVSKMKGASYPAVNNSDVLEVEIPHPSFHLQNKFAALVERVEAMQRRQARSSDKVENTFRTLMQKSFKGEVV